MTGTTVTKYYYAGSQRVAMRVKDGIADNVYFLLGDHLGSTSLTTNASGNVVSEMRYTPWGEVRYNAGVTPTDYSYTGQYSNTADFGLMFYNARWYDPYLNHFTQPDSIVPDPYNSQDYDRYAYARNNPIHNTDSTGHCVDGLTTLVCVAVAGAIIGGTIDAVIQYQEKGTIDWNSVAGSAAAGAAAAVVLTVMAPASIPAAFVAGGVANVVGNQVGAAVEGALNTNDNESFLENYSEAGGLYDGEEVTNLDQAAVDFTVGGVVNAGGTYVQHVASKFFFIDDPLMQGRNFNFIEFRYIGNGVFSPYQEPLISSVNTAGKAVLSKNVSDFSFDTLKEYFEQRLEEAY